MKRFQKQQVYDLLKSPNPDGLTRMQIAKCLGIERASVCFRVAELRDEGRIWVVRKGLCPITKTRAEFLTTSLQVAMGTQAKPLNKEGKKEEETGRLF